MSEYITINLTQPKEEIKFSYTEQNEEIVFSFSEAARGAQGEPGAAATVDQTIIDGSTNAVSGNAVFDGLALKAPIANPTFTGIVTAPRITGRCDGIEVLCKAGLAINAGQVVYITGASGSNIIIGLAQANTEPTSSKTIGISESTLANNATGYAITEGLMTVSISAPSAIEGDPIWLSSDTAGGMVFGLANKPSAPNHIVYLGVVTRKSGNTVVEIYVKIQNGAELDELADVAITSATAGQALMRGATTWENRSLVSSDISDATNLAIANTVVKRSNLGNVSFSKTTGAGATLGVIGAGAQGITSDVTTGTAGLFTATSGTAFRGYSSTGTDHAQFGEITGDNRSFVRRVLGLFGWNRGSFVQTLGSPATLTADSAIELPDIASGTIALTSDSRFTDERVPTAAGLTSKFGTNKATIANGDKFTILDSAASDAPKHTLWSLIVSTLTTAFDALYVGLTGNQTIAGNKTFSGQTELTGQAATNSTSAMTRGLTDTRYLNPRMIPGVTIHLEANELLYQGTATPTDGSEVVSWKSAHRNGPNEISVVQAGAGLKPLYKTSVQNSLNGVLFDGSNDLLQSATGFNAFISNTGRTVFVVCRPTIQVATGSGTSYQRPQLFSNLSQFNGISVSPSGAGNIFTMWDYDTAGSLIQASSAVVAVNTAVLVTSRHQTGTSMMQVNQATPVTATTLRECTNGSAMQIGTSGGSAYYTGYIFELITFGRALSDYEIAAVQSNLITKWGIS